MKFKFAYITLLVSLAVAGCAAYFSIYGLSQLFAGASTAVIIMASILELGKIVTTTALHRYWNKIAKVLRIYLTISVGVLMLITSVGIYGFLSNAYQNTANKLEIHEGEISILDNKKESFNKAISDNQKIIDSKNKRIEQLSQLRSNQENRLDNAKYNRDKSKAREDITSSTDEIKNLNSDIDQMNLKNSGLSDSIGSYNIKILNLKSNSSVSGEVGPLKYISELTGVGMAKVVNFLILLLIFVFDPLAIALIVLTNKVLFLPKDSSPIEKEENVTVNNTISDDKVIDNVLVEEPINIVENEYAEDVDEEEIIDNNVVDENLILEPKQVIEEDVIENIIEDKTPLNDVVEEVKEETPIYKKEPVIPTGKISVEDIKEVKENRGYKTPIPQSKSNNTIERVGTNKVIKNGDANKVIYKRRNGN